MNEPQEWKACSCDTESMKPCPLHSTSEPQQWTRKIDEFTVTLMDGTRVGMADTEVDADNFINVHNAAIDAEGRNGDECCAEWEKRYIELEQQLAAEREKWIAINLEHENRWSKELIDTCDKAREQRKPLVKALEALRVVIRHHDRTITSRVLAATEIIDAALAKAKEGTLR